MNKFQEWILGKDMMSRIQKLDQVEDAGHKFLDLGARQQLYNDLNRELYRYMNAGSPHMIDSTAQNYISQGYTYNSLIYSIINYMMTTASTVKWKLEERKGDEIVEEIFDHEFLDLWAEPNKDQTTSEFIEANLLYKYTTGNDYIYAPKLENGKNRGKVVSMEVMPAHEVTPIFGNVLEPVRGYQLLGSMYEREMPAEDVIHIKYINPDVRSQSPGVGLSPLKSLVVVLTQNNDAWRSLASSFQNGIPPGFISRDGSSIDSDFTIDQAEKLEERLSGRHAGPHNRNKISAIGGNAKWNQIGLSPVDMNILESIKVSFIQVCNVFKFPAPLLNYDQSLTYNNYTESQRILWTNTLKQDLEIIGQKVTRHNLSGGAYGDNLTLRPDYSQVEALQANKQEQAAWLSLAWWIKANRKQEIMGEEVDPEMDKYMIPAGLIGSDEMALPDQDEVTKQLLRLGIPMNGS